MREAARRRLVVATVNSTLHLQKKSLEGGGNLLQAEQGVFF
jgi:hypothetical protein